MFRTPFDGYRHFGVVDEGLLYRCGQPTPDQLAELIDRHKLRTVVSLRGSREEGDPDAWEVAERAICSARGVDFVSIPCNHKKPPTAAQINEFLDLTRDPKHVPVLVHCRLGQQRTLLFCTLYRVVVQGLDPDQAVQEMDAMGFDIRHRRHQRLLQAFHTFLDGAGDGPSPVSRASAG